MLFSWLHLLFFQPCHLILPNFLPIYIYIFLISIWTLWDVIFIWVISLPWLSLIPLSIFYPFSFLLSHLFTFHTSPGDTYNNLTHFSILCANSRPWYSHLILRVWSRQVLGHQQDRLHFGLWPQRPLVQHSATERPFRGRLWQSASSFQRRLLWCRHFNWGRSPFHNGSKTRTGAEGTGTCALSWRPAHGLRLGLWTEA